jgi:hypothetical protein
MRRGEWSENSRQPRRDVGPLKKGNTMPARPLFLLLTALITGGCATTGSPPADRVERPGYDNGADSHGASNKVETAAQPIAVDESAPIEVVEEKYPSGAQWKRTEGKRTTSDEFVPHGVTTTWYESGLKWSETSFRNGIKHGPRRTWYTTGAEWSYGSYVDGIENGTWTTYHPNGEKAREWHLDHGIWNGTYTEWHTDGRKRMEVTFVGVIRQGVMNIYDENGKVAAFTDFIDGVEQP